MRPLPSSLLPDRATVLRPDIDDTTAGFPAHTRDVR